MAQPFLDPQKSFIAGGKLTAPAWRYLQDLQVTLTTIDLATQVSGVLLGTNGGTGKNNGSHTVSLSGDISVAGDFSTAGAFATVLTSTAPTNVTLPTTGTLLTKDSAITAVNLNVTTGVAPNSGGIKHGRVTTGSIGAGVSALVALTWGTAFADANYTVTASVLDATAAIASLQVVHVETILAASVAVRVQNTSAGALTGTLQVIALHD